MQLGSSCLCVQKHTSHTACKGPQGSGKPQVRNELREPAPTMTVSKGLQDMRLEHACTMNNTRGKPAPVLHAVPLPRLNLGTCVPGHLMIAAAKALAPQAWLHHLQLNGQAKPKWRHRQRA